MQGGKLSDPRQGYFSGTLEQCAEAASLVCVTGACCRSYVKVLLLEDTNTALNTFQTKLDVIEKKKQYSCFVSGKYSTQICARKTAAELKSEARQLKSWAHPLQ